MVERASMETMINASLDFESTLNMHNFDSARKSLRYCGPEQYQAQHATCNGGRAPAKTVVLLDVIYELFKLIFSIIIW
jgi:hypothetical protein